MNTSFSTSAQSVLIFEDFESGDFTSKGWYDGFKDQRTTVAASCWIIIHLLAVMGSTVLMFILKTDRSVLVTDWKELLTEGIVLPLQAAHPAIIAPGFGMRILFVSVMPPDHFTKMTGILLRPISSWTASSAEWEYLTGKSGIGLTEPCVYPQIVSYFVQPSTQIWNSISWFMGPILELDRP